MTTVARIQPSESAHWYSVTGEPVYEVPKADGKGMTPTTLRHARKWNLLPSVTTILKVLDKPALTAWKIEQAVLAVVTTPRLTGELDDAFIHRVLAVDKEHDKERDAAAQLGTDIHAAIQAGLNGMPVPPHLDVYVNPVIEAIDRTGKVLWTERVLVGNGYAGKADCGLVTTTGSAIVDFKTTKTLPKECYPEHKLQLAAYARASLATKAINVYISTTEPGKIAVCEPENLPRCYKTFEHLLEVWYWLNNYRPMT
jgi:hypothetical protein